MKKALVVILFLILCTAVGYGFYQFALVKSDNTLQSEVRETGQVLAGDVQNDVSVKKVEVKQSENIDVPVTKTSIPFELIQRGARSAQTEAKNIVVDSKEVWQEVWNKTQVTTSVQTAPEIDFAKKTVIATFLGGKPHGGFGIEISKIQETPNQIEVYTIHYSSGKNCMNTQMPIAPFYIAQISKTEKPIVFVATPQVTDCVDGL